MAGSASVPNQFAAQVGQVPASQLDANWNALTSYINVREVGSGTLAARPVTPTAGQFYFANDVSGGTLYFGNGSTWVPVTLGLVPVSPSLTAPVTITDATGGGVDRPFLKLQETGSDTWVAFFEKPAIFGNSNTLSIAPLSDGHAALRLVMLAANGGQRVGVWDSVTVLPNVPHTAIPPTFFVGGDILCGDIVSFASNPMTLFIRANTGLPETAITQLFSAQKSAGVEPDGGAQLILAPFKNGGGVINDGYIQLVAYGGGTGTSANEIQFRHRDSSNTVVTTWHVGGGGNAAFYPQTDNTLDIGTAAARVKSEYLVTLYGNRYGVRAFANTGLAFSSGTYAVKLQNETFDYGGWHSTAVDVTRIAPPISGVVQCNAHFILTTHASFNGNVIDYAIRLNGATDIASYRVIGAGAAQTTKVSLATAYELAPTDYVEATIFSNQTNNDSNTINAAEVSVVRVAGV